jgi:hypothetical protein
VRARERVRVRECLRHAPVCKVRVEARVRLWRSGAEILPPRVLDPRVRHAPLLLAATRVQRQP